MSVFSLGLCDYLPTLVRQGKAWRTLKYGMSKVCMYVDIRAGRRCLCRQEDRNGIQALLFLACHIVTTKKGGKGH